jgi:hypothetical protein
MSHNGYIGVRADKALAIIGEKGPLRMSSLLEALGIRTKVAASFKITVSKLVDAGILSVTDDQDTLVSLTDQKYADPAIALDEYRAYNSEKKAEKKTETKGSSSKALFNFALRELLSITQAKLLHKRLFRVLLKSFLKRSMIENIAFGMAEQGVKA